ncbi:MAG: GHKL domain-containing protein, partial [Flavobacterium sp.]|nr:GHKL domain-containing protein [Flavobacterium sp.]
KTKDLWAMGSITLVVVLLTKMLLLVTDVTVFRELGFVKIEVKDNGKGISKENAARIFEPKFTTKSSGMGLGLAIIKNIIENYNGSITFESEENSGTTFLVSFPIV